ncbi:hypothetical protein GAY33_33740 [Azospirillum brasilense]|nr:hypothetical protein [Azospirillum argentinense]
MADFWVIVTNAATDAPECFVLTPLEVRQGCKSYGGKPWLQKDGYRRDAFRHAWSRIGAVASSTPVADCHIDPA